MEIQKLIKEKKLTFVDLFQIHHQIKILENNDHNALTEVLYHQPLNQSKKLDSEFQQSSPEEFMKKYPLAGFIFSIKDSNKLKDSDCSNGFIINLNHPIKEQPQSIEVIMEKGGIITCKGNVPQALFSMESYNNAFGETKNPYDPTRISGGSSGGEGCLVRMGLVNCAMGSDVAGSIRLPALICGVVGFKATVNRISGD